MRSHDTSTLVTAQSHTTLSATSEVELKTGAGSAPYLLFESRGSLWGVEASAVQEVLLLPEILPIDGALWWVGVLDVRGRMVPVIEQGELVGAPPRRFQTTDSVVIVATPQGDVGLIVEGVRDVRPLRWGDVEVAPASNTLGLARVDGELVRVLNLDYVARFAARENLPTETAPARLFCPDASPSERDLFVQRAHALRDDATNAVQESNAPTLVAVRLGGEVFGLELKWVREFSTRPPVTPVPGAPPDLMGLVNLRGEVVPLLDLRLALGLRVESGMAEQITFIECEGVRLGVAVEEVIDVFTPNLGMLLPPPAASGIKGDAVRAAVYYGEETLAVLDLHNLLQQGGWTSRD